MQELMQWLEENKTKNSFALAFATHFITVAIHPFADGNGRTVRLLQHLILLKKDETIAQFIPSETSIMANRERYYASIRNARGLNRLDPFLEFLAECFADSAKMVVKEGKQLLREVVAKSPEARQEKIARFIKSKSGVNLTQITEHFHQIPKRTIERDLAKLVKDKKVKASGTTRDRIYK